MHKIITGFIFLISFGYTFGQKPEQLPGTNEEKLWVDSVYDAMKPRERIGQLLILRLSSIDGKTRKINYYDSIISNHIDTFRIGGICVFQGNPEEQAGIINRLQSRSQTPLLVTIDAEWGLAMRMPDSVRPLPHQMMLGAIQDTHIVYSYARVVADQCLRFGIDMNFAPVIDINNNPQNPVINDRSFGESRERVTVLGRQYVNGLEDAGIMACVKHFPGHGDVNTDSHYDLPVIQKSKKDLDSLELYPFRAIISSGTSGAMVAHLYIPSIDNTPNRATSLSPATVKGLLKEELGFEGLCITDALEMQGVKKFYPGGSSSVAALQAGNDILLLPEDVPVVIENILNAISAGILDSSEIEKHCKKLLAYKFRFGITKTPFVNPHNLTQDLNRANSSLKRLIAENAITLVRAENPDFFPFKPGANRKPALVSFGLNPANEFGTAIMNEYGADSFYIPLVTDSTFRADSLLKKLEQYDHIIAGIHNISRRPQNNFGISKQAGELLEALGKKKNAIIFHFANPYSAKNLCSASNLVLCYEDDPVVRETALDFLKGKIPYKGILPVTICEGLPSGLSLSGIRTFAPQSGSQYIDSVIYDGISRKAMPGAVVLIAKEGKIVHHKAYGNMEYDFSEPVTTRAVFDLASVTKINATTLAIMKLFEEKKIALNKRIASYLPELKGRPAGKVTVERLLLHEGGFSPTIRIRDKILDSAGRPLAGIFSKDSGEAYPIRVAESMYASKNWSNKMIGLIAETKPSREKKYVYSDIDFILLGIIVERISGMTLDAYVKKEFYDPLGLKTTGYLPRKQLTLPEIVPTTDEKAFRNQLVRGDVHDPTAAMMGGVAGHAGVFSDAYELFVIMQMLLDEGEYNGRRYFEKNTVRLFTEYHSKISRRGLGFDKPEKDNADRKTPYPVLEASPYTFGHLGFTGTCAWADPTGKLVYVFLSNRVHPDESSRFVNLNIRTKVFEAIYRNPWIY